MSKQPVPPSRLTQLCEQAIRKLDEARALLQLIATDDLRAFSAAEQLLASCRFTAHEGESFAVVLEPIFAELETIEQPLD